MAGGAALQGHLHRVPYRGRLGTLRLEDFESTNGPDLDVDRTAADHADDDEEPARDVVGLGSLRGNIGNQNYDIPDDMDLTHYGTVVIWCLRSNWQIQRCSVVSEVSASSAARCLVSPQRHRHHVGLALRWQVLVHLDLLR
jgi:hypothetical protein